MSSETMNASWHPAHMPNSMIDTSTTRYLQSNPSPPLNVSSLQEKTIPEFEQPPSHSNSETLAHNIHDPTPVVDGAADYAEHLPRAPDEPANSGSIESAYEARHNNQISSVSSQGAATTFSPEYSSPKKHLSTLSFARTVSQEPNWGEEDEVDSQWNIQSDDMDPFKGMAQSDRTNTFPVVPPAHPSIATQVEEPLSHSQVEDIMNEVEHDREHAGIFSDQENDAEAGFLNSSEQITNDGLLQEGSPEPEEWFPDYGQSLGGIIRRDTEEESEARYEEGLPLVQSMEHTNEIEDALGSNHAAFFDGHGEEESDFFAQVANSDVAEHLPPVLERKSTGQVMDSLHFESREPIRKHKIDEENTESSSGSQANSTGEENIVSTTKGLSTVLRNQEAAIHDSFLQEGEVDLVAQWQAALAGDDFLPDDEDELLPDDDEEAENLPSSALDPATLFGDDDEGFLEDIDEQNDRYNEFPQEISPPVSAPSKALNGQVVGFSSLSGSAVTHRPMSSSSSRYLPTGAAAPVVSTGNNYAPTNSPFADFSKAPQTNTTIPLPYATPAIGDYNRPTQRPEQPRAQSFANLSKGGYASPYDLPTEVVKPRKRTSVTQMNRGYTAPSPVLAPPRSTSAFAQSSQSVQTPPLTSYDFPQTQAQPRATPAVVRGTQSGFFEDLPMPTKPKPAVRHSTGYGVPVSTPFAASGHVPSLPPPALQTASQLAADPTQQIYSSNPQHSGSLVAPVRVSPYASLTTSHVPAPVIASRYSPAPPVQQSQIVSPVLQSRYSPAPPPPIPHAQSYSQPPVTAPPPAPVQHAQSYSNAYSASVLPHQPRTSSPLAHFERNQGTRQLSSQSEGGDHRSSSAGYDVSLQPHHLPPTRELDENDQVLPSSAKSYGDLQHQYGPSPIPHSAAAARLVASTPPPPQGLASRLVNSPPKQAQSNYAPQHSAMSPSQGFAPPLRSQTQSPGSLSAGSRSKPSTTEPYKRSTSDEIPSPPAINVHYPSAPVATSRPRGFSQGYNYVTPTDGREHDPLQRWRGAPVFAWGAGGTIVTSFPQDVPRYGMNQTAPMIIRSPGEVKVRSIRDIDPLAQRLATFPGPLKGKSKKKEVVTWLTAGIEVLETNASYLPTLSSLSHEDKRTEERILLWKILRVFIENDGLLEGNPIVEKAVRVVISPGLEDETVAEPSFYATGAELSGISHSSTTAPRAEAVDPAAVDQLRKHLLRGDREKAVWDAVDKRLWAHALLISNTVSRDLYKKVAQEFVQKEVKNIGDNTEPLAALYEIFAGNFEESIDELVPPSARAGFQMISTSSTTGPSKDAIDGLDRWRETLGLVLSNRSTDDAQALNSLGKLLSGYGRAEAAHICFLFARNLFLFGGIDAPGTSIVLVGSDHLRQPFDFDRELEPILLSEVFEYGMMLSSSLTMAFSSPHLAVYKLLHAKVLAEYGLRDKALQYSESIATAITSQTKRSPYHHPLLVSELDDLNKRLKQSPKDGSGSWISKPSIDKAKGSVWATFNKFVAGDEAASSGPDSGNASEVGPFSRIAGGTPTISRSPSNADIYSSYNGGIMMNGAAAKLSKYAPGSVSTPSSYEAQPGGSQGRSSLEERTSNEFQRYQPQRQLSQMSDYRPSSQPLPISTKNQSVVLASSSYTPQSSYMPHINTFSSYEPASYTPHTPLSEQASSNFQSSPQLLHKSDGQQQQIQNSFEQTETRNSSSSYEPFSADNYVPQTTSSHGLPAGHESASSNGYDPPSSGYEPPSSGYQPYEPATMDDEPESPIHTRSKKNSFMDDDEDDIPVLKEQSETHVKTKAEKDREADEAFRRAAEADAQKASAAPAKKAGGWGLTGWFAKKETDMSKAGASVPNKPIRAKLGEASSFVYDPELKRWINKKGGAEDAQARTSTPPPPKAGPPRTASGPPTSTPRNGPPPQQPRAVSETLPSTDSQSTDFLDPLLGLGLGPPVMVRSASNGSASGGASGPPSRPGTGVSNASSIDDLLGPAVPRGPRGTVKGKKKGRGYVDVMGGEK